MYDVFISYSTKNEKQAEKIREFLEANGISCWYAPVNIHGNRDFTEEIPNAICGAKAFLLLVSNEAQESKWVKREMRYADKYDIPIYPFFLEECELRGKFDFVLGDNQHYAFSLGFEEQKNRLLGDLKEDFEELKNKPETERNYTSFFSNLSGKRKLILCGAVLAVVLAAAVMFFILSGGKDYVIWNPAYNMALTGESVNTHYHAGEQVSVKNEEIFGYSDKCIWQVEYIDDEAFIISQNGVNLGMEPGYNGIGLGGDYTADKWELEKTADGCYIRNIQSGYYLEWYGQKNNWSTHNIITDENRKQFLLNIDEVS